MTRHREIARAAEVVLRQASDTLTAMQNRDLRATRKEHLDVVTEADLAAEEIIVSGLSRITPGAAILAEERGASGAQKGPRWIIDPLDGTVNYASGLPWFSTTIAYQEGGETIIGLTHAPAARLTARYVLGEVAEINDRPVRVAGVAHLADAVVSVVLTSHFDSEEVARAARIIGHLGGVARGVRVVVSGALEMSLVACGKLAAFVSIKADVVSHAAAMPLVRAAGGAVTTLSGADARDEDLVKIASNGLVHDELLSAVRAAV